MPPPRTLTAVNNLLVKSNTYQKIISGMQQDRILSICGLSSKTSWPVPLWLDMKKQYLGYSMSYLPSIICKPILDLIILNLALCIKKHPGLKVFLFLMLSKFFTKQVLCVFIQSLERFLSLEKTLCGMITIFGKNLHLNSMLDSGRSSIFGDYFIILWSGKGMRTKQSSV